MNILIDGRPFIRSSAGISTVLRCILVSWAKQHEEDTLYVILPKPMHPSMTVYKFPENVKWIKAKSKVFSYLPNLAYLLIMVPFLIKKLAIDIYFAPVPTLPFLIPQQVKKIVFVHDVVNLEYKDTMALRNKIALCLFFKRSIKKANILWANSEYTKDRIDYYFPNRVCKKIFVGCAADRSIYKKIDLTKEEEATIRREYGIKGRFVLFVGSLEPRKNLPFLLNIFPEIYKKTRSQLVVVGAKGWKNSSIKDVVNNKDFPQECTIFCGYITNNDLVKLYNMADCFVSTSLNEGFGLPQLEALLCGCPIVTSDNSAMTEVAKGVQGAVLVRGYDHNYWIDIISNVISNPTNVDTQQLRKYSWEIILSNFHKDYYDIFL